MNVTCLPVGYAEQRLDFPIKNGAVQERSTKSVRAAITGIRGKSDAYTHETEKAVMFHEENNNTL